MTVISNQVYSAMADQVGVRSINGRVAGALHDYLSDLQAGTVPFDDVITKGPWVDVRAFGAVGDGVTDDTAAIQAAIDSLSIKGGTVYLPGNKTYIVSKQIPLYSNITIEGGGSNCVIKINPLNWNGGIARFYCVFSTVDVTDRPQEILWRIGTGSITYRNIHIKGIQFDIGRDGSVLTPTQINTADFNVIRFEDAEYCTVENCRFIDDKQVAGNAGDLTNNGTAVVFFVRSQKCRIINCYAYKCKMVIMLETIDCEAEGNTIDTTISTGIESACGVRPKMKNNKFINGQYWATSTLGVNDTDALVDGNYIEKAAITGIHIGESAATSANFYSLPRTANRTICQNNIIVSGDGTISGNGKRGIFVLSGTDVVIKHNTIYGLITDVADPENTFAGGVVLYLANRAIVDGNKVDGGHYGVVSYGAGLQNIIIQNNYLTNCVYGGIGSQTNPSNLNISGNTIISSKYGLKIYYSNVTCENNYFSTLTDGLSIKGNYDVIFNNNRLLNVATVTMLFLENVKSLCLLKNTFSQDTAASVAVWLYNCTTLLIAKVLSGYNDLSGGTSPIYVNGAMADVASGAKFSSTISLGVADVIQGAADANSAATDVAGIVADHNDLLAKLRTAKLIAT